MGSMPETKMETQEEVQ